MAIRGTLTPAILPSLVAHAPADRGATSSQTKFIYIFPYIFFIFFSFFFSWLVFKLLADNTLDMKEDSDHKRRKILQVFFFNVNFK